MILGGDKDKNVFETIWDQYEQVIVESLISSFGLDFIIKDQLGGDVDTIHNVRGSNPETIPAFKNKKYQEAYKGREKYSHKMVDGKDTNFQRIKKEARTSYERSGNVSTVRDAYENKDLYFLGNKKNKHPTDVNANLDHVISAKEIYDDPGRILAGIDAKDLADDKDNLKWTNEKLNKSMGEKSIPEYIKSHQELDKNTQQHMMSAYNRSKKNYEHRIAVAYYTSSAFAKDTAIAAGKVGIKMGIRQMLGLILFEMYLGAKNELVIIKPGSSFKEMIVAVGNGIKKGAENAKRKYKEIIERGKEGLTAGLLSSLTTTLCNVFFTTAKNLVRCIRQIYASAVQAMKILLFNPDNLYLGDRIKTATVVIATGASVLVGTSFGEMIAKTPAGMIPVVGQTVVTFSSSLVSGLLSCSFLIFIDRSGFMNKVVDGLNRIPTEANNYRIIADAMETLAAKIGNLDIEQFKKDTQVFNHVALQIDKCQSEDDLNTVLFSSYKAFDINIPWKGDFDEFMENNDNKLVFE